jgi:hypothetical protein
VICLAAIVIITWLLDREVLFFSLQNEEFAYGAVASMDWFDGFDLTSH